MNIQNNDQSYLGKKYNRLTVIDFKSVRGNHAHAKLHWEWVCRCDCGNVGVFLPSRVRSGHTKSCGCYKSDLTIERNKKTKTVHGGKNTRLYTIWNGMKLRCYNKNNKDYPNWGGRGIRICDDWRSDFSEFRNWAVANGYSDELTIDRIDVNGDYSPTNCRWIPLCEQAKNTRATRYVIYRGEKTTVFELAEKFGMNYFTLYQRIFYDGWSVERAVEEKVKPTHTALGDRCRAQGISLETVRSRIKRGWSEDEAVMTPTFGRGANYKTYGHERNF